MDTLMPILAAASGAALGYGVGQSPTGDVNVLTQPFQTMSLLDYRRNLGEHYQQQAAHNKVIAQQHAISEARQQAAERRQQAEFDYKKKLEEQTGRIKATEEQRKQYWFNNALRTLKLPGPGHVQTTGGPGGLPTVPEAGASVLEPVGPPPGAVGQAGPAGYDQSFTIDETGLSTTFKPSQAMQWQQQAATLAQQATANITDPTERQRQYANIFNENMRVLSGLESKTPSPFEKNVQDRNFDLGIVKEYNDASKQFLLGKSAFGAVRAAYAIGPNRVHNAADDIALTYAFAKMMDPVTGVRDAERTTLQEGMALFDRMRQFIPKLETGQTFPPDFRAKIYNTAERMYQQSVQVHHATVEQPFRQTTAQFNRDPSFLPNYTAEEQQTYSAGVRPPFQQPLPPVVPGQETYSKTPAEAYYNQLRKSGKSDEAARRLTDARFRRQNTP